LISITIPASVIDIGDYAFSDCSSLTKVTFTTPPSASPALTTIGVSAFSNCKGLTNTSLTNPTFKIPGSVKEIGDSAFYGCKGFTVITIPSSVTRIDSEAFYACSLTEVEIRGLAPDFSPDAFPGDLVERYIDKGRSPGIYTRPNTTILTWTWTPLK